jgi:hypothetical protein
MYIEHFPINKSVQLQIHKNYRLFVTISVTLMLAIKKMWQKAWKFHANCLDICLTKVILLPSEKKRLVILVQTHHRQLVFGLSVQLCLIIASKSWDDFRVSPGRFSED